LDADPLAIIAELSGAEVELKRVEARLERVDTLFPSCQPTRYPFDVEIVNRSRAAYRLVTAR
jgi:hypothetical protein